MPRKLVKSKLVRSMLQSRVQVNCGFMLLHLTTRYFKVLTTKCVHVHVAKEMAKCFTEQRLKHPFPIWGPILVFLFMNICADVIFENYIKAKHVFFFFMWKLIIVCLLKSKSNFVLSQCSLFFEEIDLLSLSGSYESAASHRLLFPFTGAVHWQADDWQSTRAKVVEVCVCICVSIMCRWECVCVHVSPAWRQKFVNGCRDCRHTLDSSGFPTATDKTERHIRERERERLSAKAIHSATGTGAIFHKIKAPLFGETCCLCSHDIEYLEAAGRAAFGCRCAKRAKWKWITQCKAVKKKPFFWLP